MKIITNNHWHKLITWYDLKKKDQEWYDYDHSQDDRYFYYRDTAYSLSDFVSVNSILSQGYEVTSFGEHAYIDNSFFSNILIKLSDCGEAVQVATYIS